jgi:hypothetical protein
MSTPQVHTFGVVDFVYASAYDKLREAVSESIAEMVNLANFVDDEPSVQQALREAVRFLKTATGVDLEAKAREAREGTA